MDFRAGGRTVADFRKQLTKAHAVSASFDVAGNLFQKALTRAGQVVLFFPRLPLYCPNRRQPSRAFSGLVAWLKQDQ